MSLSGDSPQVVLSTVEDETAEKPEVSVAEPEIAAVVPQAADQEPKEVQVICVSALLSFQHGGSFGRVGLLYCVTDKLGLSNSSP